MADIVIKDRDYADVTYEDVKTVKMDTTDGGVQYYTPGEPEEKTVELDFSSGDMELTPENGKVWVSLKIKQPAGLVPENIAENVIVAGLVGTCKMDDGITPAELKNSTVYGALSKMAATGLSYYRCYRNSDNGIFSLRLEAWSEDLSQALASTDAGTSTGTYYLYAKDFAVCPEIQPFTPAIRFAGNGFTPSPAVASTTEVYLVLAFYDTANCALSQTPAKFFSVDTPIFTITPDDGYYIPREIEVISEGGAVEATYDNSTGKITLTMAEVPQITLRVDAPGMPWLFAPDVVLGQRNNLLLVNSLDANAEATPVLYNGESILTLEDPRTGMASYEVTPTASGATYGFVLGDDGYYKENTGTTRYRAAVCRVDFYMATAGTVTISYVNYGYSSYDYGIVSNVDCTLSSSYSSDIDTTSSNVYKTFKSSNSTTVNTLTLSVPAGSHFVCFKYRRYNSTSASYYFKFKVSTAVPEQPSYLLTEVLPAYGVYPLAVYSTAEGYTDSYSTVLEYTNKPHIAVADGVLTITNVHSNATAIEIVVDDELLDTVVPGGTGEDSVDLLQYNLSIAQHSIFVRVVCDDGTIGVSDTTADALLFAYATFADASWAEVDAVCKAGFHKTLYSLGDYKTTTGRGGTWYWEILDFEHDDLADGTGKAALTLGTKYLPNFTAAMMDSAKSDVANWGWHNCTFRTSTVPSILAEFDEDFLTVIKSVKKYYLSGYGGTEKVTYDKLFAFSNTEITGNTATGGYRYAALTAGISTVKMLLEGDATTVSRTYSMCGPMGATTNTWGIFSGASNTSNTATYVCYKRLGVCI